MAVAAAQRSLPERALEVLRRAGNPFRNYFARNPDDEVCARYHVPELFATERDQILGVVDLYRYDPNMHSEVIPVLGNKGSGKTHLLHTIKHGGDGAWQVLVTPGVYQKDTDFLEYLLFQLIDTVLGGGKQKGTRPQLSAKKALRSARRALRSAAVSARCPAWPGCKLGLGPRRQERAAPADQLGQNRLHDWWRAASCTEVSLARSCCTFVCGFAWCPQHGRPHAAHPSRVVRSPAG